MSFGQDRNEQETPFQLSYFCDDGMGDYWEESGQGTVTFWLINFSQNQLFLSQVWTGKVPDFLGVGRPRANKASQDSATSLFILFPFIPGSPVTKGKKKEVFIKGRVGFSETLIVYFMAHFKFHFLNNPSS